MTETGDATPPRRRGRPARIDRTRILDAAKRHDPRTVTMKAVADDLGVDPTTLNYHVRGRDGLLQLLAADAFQTAFAAADFTGPADWRTTIRSFAVAIRDGIIATSALAIHFRLENDIDFATLGPFEVTLTSLVDAGFDLLDAAHTLTLVGELADAAARRSLDRTDEVAATQGRELREALLSGAGERLSSLRRLAEVERDFNSDTQFEFGLGIITSGLEKLLTARHTS